MPKRTTEFQTIVHFVRKHTAAAGVTVTESRLLRDSRLSVDREVDIVIEGTFDGEPSVTSIEVIEQSRPATVTWVEQEIAKHRHLPTNRLVLISRSGYSKTALQAVAAEGGWVDTVHPEIVLKDGEPVVKRLYTDKVEFKLLACRIVVEPPGGATVAVRVAPDNMVFDSTGRPIDSTLRLAHEALRLDWLAQKFAVAAHNHPDRGNLTGFSLGFPLKDRGYFLKHEESQEHHEIAKIVLAGDFVFTQYEMAFTMAKLGGRVYGAGRGPFLGRDAVWVGTDDDNAQMMTISWKALDAVVDEPAGDHPDVAERRFPGLLEIPPPADWTDEEAEDGIVLVAQQPS